MTITVYGETNVGRHRDHNEDAFAILCDLDKKWQEVNDLQVDLTASNGAFFVVADGMGGANAGEVASSIAVNLVKERVRSLKTSLIDEKQVYKYLTSILFDAHNSIVKKARNNEEMKGMGTTMVLGCIIKCTLYVVWAGDSRMYIYNATRHKQLVPFSEDHSLVWSRVKKGEITAEEARLSDDSNLIINALGDSFQKPMPDFKFAELAPGDRIILCSDGLNSMLSDSGIQQIVDFNSHAKDTCQALISAACNAGGNDNITVIVIDVNTTDPVSKNTGSKNRKKKKWFRFVFMLVCIALIASALFYYSVEIKSYLKNQLNQVTYKDDDQQIIQSKKSNVNEPERINNVPASSDGSGNLNKTLNNETVTKDKLVVSDVPVPDHTPLQLKEELETEYKRIDVLMTDLKRYKPGGDMYSENEAFCLTNEKKIDNIMYKLDSIKTQIKTVVSAPGNKIIAVKDPHSAADILKTLKASVDKLVGLKETILTNPKEPEKVSL